MEISLSMTLYAQFLRSKWYNEEVFPVFQVAYGMSCRLVYL